MQKGDIAKLKLLLAGISARLTKNRDYFVQCRLHIHFRQRKNLTPKLSLARTRTARCVFRAAPRRVDAADILRIFCL